MNIKAAVFTTFIVVIIMVLGIYSPKTILALFVGLVGFAGVGVVWWILYDILGRFVK